MTDYTYIGSELSLFAMARNWKSYFRSHLVPYLRGAEVLEVGAGIGANTRLLAGTGFQRWVCLEPDRQLAARLKADLPAVDRTELVIGRLADLDSSRRFDAILYLDVLEHIPDDHAELGLATERLKTRGTLIVLAPAHQWLFTPFDEAVGHCRRYTKASLAAAAPRRLRAEKLIYLDSIGLLASLGNRLLLQSRMPTEAQIRIWDRWLVPCSRWVDPLLAYHGGKSVLAVWRNPGAG